MQARSRMADEKIDLSLQEILARQGANGKGHEDPTANVKDLVREVIIRMDSLRESDRRREDSLREAERRLAESEIRSVREIMQLRSDHIKELQLAESERINAIRAVDVNAVAIANERANAQAQVLANQLQISAETSRSLVASTAVTQKQQYDQTTAQLSDRLTALEKLQYEGKGLSGTVPPAVSERLSQLEENRFRNEGKSGLSTPILLMITAAVTSAVVGLIVYMIQSAAGG